MATHSSILAWRIPWIEEPSRLQGLKELDRLYKGVEGEILCPRVLPQAIQAALLQGLPMTRNYLQSSLAGLTGPQRSSLPKGCHNILSGQVGSLDLNPHSALLRELALSVPIIQAGKLRLTETSGLAKARMQVTELGLKSLSGTKKRNLCLSPVFISLYCHSKNSSRNNN